MKHKVRIEVEPLSESRWRKVDEAVFAALDAGEEPVALIRRAPRRRWPLAIAAAACLALAAAALLLLTRSPSAPLALAPSHIETGDARSFVQLGFASLDVAPSSAVTTSGDDRQGVLVVLERGAVECEVAPRVGRPPFVVQAGPVRVTVVGTRFSVARVGEVVTVSVGRGVVEVAHDGTTTRLTAGEVWPSSAPSTAPSSRPPVASAPASSGAPPGTPSSAPPPRPRPPAPSDQATYEQAASLERSDPEQARALYLRVAGHGGPWASNALFAAGRLAADRGQKAEAKKLLEQYLERHPNGLNAEDARRLLAGLR